LFSNTINDHAYKIAQQFIILTIKLCTNISPIFTTIQCTFDHVSRGCHARKNSLNL